MSLLSPIILVNLPIFLVVMYLSIKTCPPIYNERQKRIGAVAVTTTRAIRHNLFSDRRVVSGIMRGFEQGCAG